MNPKRLNELPSGPTIFGWKIIKEEFLFKGNHDDDKTERT